MAYGTSIVEWESNQQNQGFDGSGLGLFMEHTYPDSDTETRWKFQHWHMWFFTNFPHNCQSDNKFSRRHVKGGPISVSQGKGSSKEVTDEHP